ncbi:hypothetical protein ABY59_0200012 [Enterobacter phage phiEap-2]|uniref:hypothetical protein n=1 Tax=Enterobacter phage phiEap-2 TaxID=1701257 RepID=UPI0006BD0B0C|nr:hypothetical protein ABY59_0200012 [Enterobacter phage phiEap-2]ALA45579.1 hypothetical protein ABY59_0200012 [Enterobacter phage phiEap-2]
MTNTEYEKLSVSAANGEAMLAHADSVIANIEAALIVAQEARREIINRYNLNKCEHDWVENVELGRKPWIMCAKCGVHK